MATKKELTGKRDLGFSQWIRVNLPDSSTGFMVSDVDFVLYNYKTRKVMIIEVKTRGANVKTWQHRLYENLHQWLWHGVRKVNENLPDHYKWEYLGVHLIRFEKTSFENGVCFFNKKAVTESELANILSLK